MLKKSKLMAIAFAVAFLGSCGDPAKNQEVNTSKTFVIGKDTVSVDNYGKVIKR